MAEKFTGRSEVRSGEYLLREYIGPKGKVRISVFHLKSVTSQIETTRQIQKEVEETKQRKATKGKNKGKDEDYIVISKVMVNIPVVTEVIETVEELQKPSFNYYVRLNKYQMRKFLRNWIKNNTKQDGKDS